MSIKSQTSSLSINGHGNTAKNFINFTMFDQNDYWSYSMNY